MVEVVVLSAGGCAGVCPLGEVVSRLTGGALVASTPGTALAGGVAPLATPAVTPESPGTLWHTHPVAQTCTTAHRDKRCELHLDNVKPRSCDIFTHIYFTCIMYVQHDLQ